LLDHSTVLSDIRCQRYKTTRIFAHEAKRHIALVAKVLSMAARRMVVIEGQCFVPTPWGLATHSAQISLRSQHFLCLIDSKSDLRQRPAALSSLLAAGQFLLWKKIANWVTALSYTQLHDLC
jgi:hypothetical protein